MPDWKGSMQQTFEYYVVNPSTWKDDKLITTVRSCTINRDLEADTLGSATINIVDSIGECYIRVYLITIQNGVREKHPLGTFLVQTPTSDYDGKTRNVSMDAYTPLLELKENQPPLGYTVPKSKHYKVEKNSSGQYVKTETELKSVIGAELKVDGKNVLTTTGEIVFKQDDKLFYCVPKSANAMNTAYRLMRENMRGPVLPVDSSNVLHNDFVADVDDTWFSFLRDLVSGLNHEIALDDISRVQFIPKRNIDTLQPVWTYDDDNSSILYPEITMHHDLYGIPNVVEVIYSTKTTILRGVARNDDENSPTSTVNRGREIIYRVLDAELIEEPTQAQVDDYAYRVLKSLSTVEYTVSYSHGYCPVRLGDCVRLNYEKAGIKNIKAKVVSQTINCAAGCKVTEKAVFTTNLWR